MEKQRAFKPTEVAPHKSKQDCWLIIGGRVLEITKFLEEHPGGEEVLLECAGKDATRNFEDVGHSNAAKQMLLKYQIGYLEGKNVQGNDSDDPPPAAAPYTEIKAKKQMKAFVIKEDPKPKYAVFLEFFVPVMVVVSFLAYRYLTGAAS